MNTFTKVLVLSVVSVIAWYVFKQFIPVSKANFDNYASVRLGIMLLSAVAPAILFAFWGKEKFAWTVMIFLFLIYWTSLGRINILSVEALICGGVMIVTILGLVYAQAKSHLIGAVTVLFAFILTPHICVWLITDVLGATGGASVQIPTW